MSRPDAQRARSSLRSQTKPAATTVSAMPRRGMAASRVSGKRERLLVSRNAVPVKSTRGQCSGLVESVVDPGPVLLLYLVM